MAGQLGQGCNPLQPNKVIINVGGNRFETYKSTLRNIPDTRLAWITESKADNPDYDPISGEYFFDRHPSMFLMILNYYRTGKLHIPTDVCGPAFEEELMFWGIDEKQIEACCWGNYSQHRDAQQTLDELKIDTNFENDDAESDNERDLGSTAEKFGIAESQESKSSWEWIRQKLWLILDNQTSSAASKIFASISLTLTLLVITTFILETDPTCRIPRNESVPHVNEKSMSFIEYRRRTKPHPVLYYIEIVCMCELTLETIIRLVVCPEKKMFFKNALNIVDVLSLLSFYITSILFMVDKNYMDAIPIELQVLRIVRVFRIFKVATHLPALKILFHTLKASARELLLMLMLIISLIICFATLIYFAEQVNESPQNDFKSIPIGFWWAIVTMTTLGYGDTHPKTAVGYIFGSFCAITGVLLIALPIPIIVSNFSTYYNHAKAQEKLPKKRKVPLVGAADALKQQAEEISLQISQYDIRSADCSRKGSPTEELEIVHMRNGGSRDTMKHSDDSGINGSAYSSERTMGGISVTFTDIDENEEIISTVPKHNNQNGKGHYSGVSTLAVQLSQAQRERTHNSMPSPTDSMRRKKIAPAPMAVASRRASLLPGGVSSAPAEPANISSRNSLPVKTTAARERRRSLMPATYTRVNEAQ